MIARRTVVALVLLAVSCGGQEQGRDDATSDAFVDDISTAPDDARTIDGAPPIDSTLPDTTPADFCPDQYVADYGHDVPPMRCPVPVSDPVTFDHLRRWRRVHRPPALRREHRRAFEPLGHFVRLMTW